LRFINAKNIIYYFNISFRRPLKQDTGVETLQGWNFKIIKTL
jgi:hypothetical protein